MDHQHFPLALNILINIIQAVLMNHIIILDHHIIGIIVIHLHLLHLRIIIERKKVV